MGKRRLAPPSVLQRDWVTKLAAAVLVGAYLWIRSDRWHDCDQDVDEGYARVEHLRLLALGSAQRLLAAPV